MLNLKKTAFWIVAVCLAASAVLAVCLLTIPKSTVTEQTDARLAEYLNSAVAEHNSGSFIGGEYRCGVFNALGAEKTGDTTVVYGFASYAEYDFDNDKKAPVLVAGCEMPAVITVKEENGEFITAAYREPSDGSRYERDVREMFPKSLRKEAFSGLEENSAKAKQLLDSAAAAYFEAYERTPEAYERTPYDEREGLLNSGGIVILKAHSRLSDGTWKAEDDNTYKYRLEIKGRLNSAAKDTTFIVLSNLESISFDRTAMASGLSSNMKAYFTPDEAVIVGMG